MDCFCIGCNIYQFLILLNVCCTYILVLENNCVTGGVEKKLSQTLGWFSPDPGKIFDDQYSYSSVWYRAIFLVPLCRQPLSYVSSVAAASGPQCVGDPVHCCSYLPFWPKLPHSTEKQMLVYWLASLSDAASLQLLLAVTKNGEKKKQNEVCWPDLFSTTYRAHSGSIYSTWGNR